MAIKVAPVQIAPQLNHANSAAMSKSGGAESQGFGALIDSIYGLRQQGTAYDARLHEVALGKGNPEQLIETAATLETELKVVQSTLSAALAAAKEIFHMQP